MSKEYSSYRYVGQKWAAEIPEHWDAKRLKVIFSMRTERNNPVITDNILSLTAKQGVVPYAKKEGTGGNKPKDDLSKYNIARENDLLINCMNVVSGAAGVSRYFGAISPVYYALYPRTKENVWYYHHIFRLLPFQRSLIGLGKGILMHESDSGKLNTVRMRISMDYLGNVLLPVPPRDEQDQIVRFLDWKVSEINKLISISRKKIVEYRELRKAVIDQGVFHGFTNTGVIHSGIHWLGDIPQGWKVMPLKRICKVNASIVEQIKKTDDNDKVTFLPMENVSETGLLDCSIKRAVAEVKTGFSSFAKGDVVVAEVDPVPAGKVGHIVEPELDLLSVILSDFNDMFGNINWNDADNVRRQILEIPAMVSRDEKYQNAMKNSDEQSARMESERALQQVIFAIMADNMELFKQFQDNPSFKKWLSDLVFNLTYNREGKPYEPPKLENN